MEESIFVLNDPGTSGEVIAAMKARPRDYNIVTILRIESMFLRRLNLDVLLKLPNIKTLVTDYCREGLNPLHLTHIENIEFLNYNGDIGNLIKDTPSLKKLKICGYDGKLPTDLGNVTHLHLHNCAQVDSLPSDVHNLVELTLTNTWIKETVLNVDGFGDLSLLKKLEIGGYHLNKDPFPSSMPALETLILDRCKGVSSIPDDLPNLKTLKVKYVRKDVTYPTFINPEAGYASTLRIFEMCTVSGFTTMPSLPALIELSITECEEFKVCDDLSPHLRRIRIRLAPLLTSLPHVEMKRLDMMRVEYCSLRTFDKLPVSTIKKGISDFRFMGYGYNFRIEKYLDTSEYRDAVSVWILRDNATSRRVNPVILLPDDVFELIGSFVYE